MRHAAVAFAAVMVAALVVVLVIIPVATRPSCVRWGATGGEVSAALPGDDLVPRAQSVSTRAVTIQAPPEEVWPWLVQTGVGRAGWYTYDWYYELQGSAGFIDGDSSTRIVPKFQTLSVGDFVRVDRTAPFRVMELDRPRALVLLERTDTRTGRPFALDDQPAEYVNTTLAWVVEPVGKNASRLILRSRTDTRGWANAALNGGPFEFAAWMMSRANLLGIKERAERAFKLGVRNGSPPPSVGGTTDAGY